MIENARLKDNCIFHLGYECVDKLLDAKIDHWLNRLRKHCTINAASLNKKISL